MWRFFAFSQLIDYIWKDKKWFVNVASLLSGIRAEHLIFIKPFTSSQINQVQYCIKSMSVFYALQSDLENCVWSRRVLVDTLLPVTTMLLSQSKQHDSFVEMLNYAMLEIRDHWLAFRVLVNFEVGLRGIKEIVDLFVIDF